MQKDILGNTELESIKLDWSIATPGLMSTTCCASGTCDNSGSPKHVMLHTAI